MIIIKIILIAIFVIVCLLIISKGINKQLLRLYQNERDKTDTLYRIIFHIRQQLSLLKLKECPEEEFKNIPFEIIEWINRLEKISNGENDGIRK